MSTVTALDFILNVCEDGGKMKSEYGRRQVIEARAELADLRATAAEVTALQ